MIVEYAMIYDLSLSGFMSQNIFFPQKVLHKHVLILVSHK